jgi:hypothetical protein
VGIGTIVQVGVAVFDGVSVRVGVTVVTGVALGARVAVATGWLPILTMRWDNGPKVPLTSRNWTVRTVSPGGKILSALTTMQNCTTRGAEEIKLGELNASTVQARARLVFAPKAQLKSLRAFDTV